MTKIEFRRPRWTVALLLVALIPLVTAAPGCGDDATGPSGDDTGLVFEPPVGALTLDASEELTFRVLVDGTPLVADFAIDATVVSRATEYLFVPEVLGQVTITAAVEVDGAPQTATWVIDIEDTNLRPTPPVNVLRASLAATPGGVDLLWERPAVGRTDVEIVTYEVGYATEYFAADDFEQVDRFTVASLGPEAPIIQRETRLGLVERETYVFRVRAIDRVGRASSVSDTASSRATGAYTFSGRVRELRPDRAIAPLANVVISVGGTAFDFTEADGLFEISDLPDTGKVVLTAAEQSGARYYEIETDPLDPVDRTFDLVLPGNAVIEYPLADESGELASISRLEFIRLLTDTERAVPGESAPLFTWREYPVPLYVHPLVIETDGDVIDYADVMVTAAESWNDAAGELLFDIRRIDEPYPISDFPLPGVVYLVDPSLTGARYGTTTVQVPTVPDDASSYDYVPQGISIGFQAGLRVLNFTRVIAVHELGHALRLRHDSPAEIGTHVMTAGVRGDSQLIPDEEEALAARFVRYAAGHVEMQWYREPSGLQK